MEMNDKLYQLTPLMEEDQFFKETIEQYTAGWQRKWLESYSGYADKYKDAFNILTAFTPDSSYNKDQLVYPIMFLARHIIELRLKELIQLCNGERVIFYKKPKCKLLNLLDSLKCKSIPKETKKQKEPTHSLSSLWHEFDSVYKGEKNKQYLKVGKLINELNSLDSKSDTFRYPIHKDGSPTSISEFVNIENFVNVFLKVDSILEGLEAELNHAIDSMSYI